MEICQKWERILDREVNISSFGSDIEELAINLQHILHIERGYNHENKPFKYT
jgi:hypothetical protein